MSWQASKWAVQQKTGSIPAKAVLLVLAEAADAKAHSTTLSTATLATRTDASRRTVIKALADLTELGLIRRARRSNASTGTRMADEITLQVDIGLGADPAPSLGADPALWAPHPKVQETTGQGADYDAPRCGSCTAKEEGFVQGLQPSVARTRKPRSSTKMPEGFPDFFMLEELKARASAGGIGTEVVDLSVARFAAYKKRSRSTDWIASLQDWVADDIAKARLRGMSAAKARRPTAQEYAIATFDNQEVGNE